MSDLGTKTRIACTVQYDGGDFFGWQLQPRERSVQGELERVLSRLCASPIRVVGAGRTDRGVHALGQVFAVDVPSRWTAPKLERALNALLPAEIWIAHAAVVRPDFHPRFDALERTYRYRIGTVRASASPFLIRWCWPLARTPELDRMQEATLCLLGDHSFRAFARAGQEERGDRCIVREAAWLEWDRFGLEFRITANRFLHRMIRLLVGTLVEIGLGRRPISDVEHLLAGAAGLESSPPAPAQGLFLDAVRYPPGAYGERPFILGGPALPIDFF